MCVNICFCLSFYLVSNCLFLFIWWPNCIFWLDGFCIPPPLPPHIYILCEICTNGKKHAQKYTLFVVIILSIFDSMNHDWFLPCDPWGEIAIVQLVGCVESLMPSVQWSFGQPRHVWVPWIGPCIIYDLFKVVQEKPIILSFFLLWI